MQKGLIITADDFGLHESINEAVEAASRAGVLTAASLMVTAPASADAIRRAEGLAQLRVGLHVVLTDGWSTLARELIPALADAQGRFDGSMLRNSLRFFARPSVQRQLEAEIRAQFARFARTGLRLDHVNMHKHFHLHPTVLNILLRVGRDYGVCAVRVPDEQLWFAARGSWLCGTSALLLKPWVALMKRRLRASGIFHNDRIFGISASGAMDEARLVEIIGRLPQGVTEIYLHPATVSGGAIAASMSGYRHADELEGLMSPRVRAAIGASGVTLGGFADLKSHAGTKDCDEDAPEQQCQAQPKK
jgi:chitin disaccharide deacetylase